MGLLLVNNPKLGKKLDIEKSEDKANTEQFYNSPSLYLVLKIFRSNDNCFISALQISYKCFFWSTLTLRDQEKENLGKVVQRYFQQKN